MVAIDGVGFNWSYITKDEVPTNMALMAFLDSETESKNANKEIPNKLKESLDAPLVKNRVSDNKDCTVESHVVVEKKTVVPTVDKIEFVKAKQQEKPVRKLVKYAEIYRENKVNVVKASACWVWRPTKPNGASITLKRHNYIDNHLQQVQEDQGCVDIRFSRHMTGNMSYLSNFKEFSGGYVTFGRGVNGGRITEEHIGQGHSS
nr:hypothetical protein [Tanacetum cinerariifolium]